MSPVQAMDLCRANDALSEKDIWAFAEQLRERNYTKMARRLIYSWRIASMSGKAERMAEEAAARRLYQMMRAHQGHRVASPVSR